MKVRHSLFSFMLFMFLSTQQVGAQTLSTWQFGPGITEGSIFTWKVSGSPGEFSVKENGSLVSKVSINNTFFHVKKNMISVSSYPERDGSKYRLKVLENDPEGLFLSQQDKYESVFSLELDGKSIEYLDPIYVFVLSPVYWLLHPTTIVYDNGTEQGYFEPQYDAYKARGNVNLKPEDKYAEENDKFADFLFDTISKDGNRITYTFERYNCPKAEGCVTFSDLHLNYHLRETFNTRTGLLEEGKYLWDFDYESNGRRLKTTYDREITLVSQVVWRNVILITSGVVVVAIIVLIVRRFIS